MISKPIVVAIATSLFFCSGCAAKNKWFSRRDYSEMQDPFMEDEALASSDEPKGRSGGDSTGRAKLGSSLADSGRATTGFGASISSGPKPIQRGGMTGGSDRSGRVAEASYPQDSEVAPAGRPVVKSHQGPALSDFLSQKKSAASASIEAAEEDANQRAAEAARSVMAARDTKTPGNPAGTRATPSMSEEAEGFSDFLQKSTDTVSRASHTATETIKQGESSVNDFASWAEQKQDEWTQETTDPSEMFDSVPAATKQGLKGAGQQAMNSANDALMDFSDQGPDFDSDDSAQPLMKKYSAPPSAKAVKAAVDVEENPFENPFDVAEEAPFDEKPKAASVSKSLKKSPSSGKSLDDSFQMDSGWKPAHMTRP